jgi:uncharacterized protein (DUF952 family)
MPESTIYKVLRPAEWAHAQAHGVFSGSPVDLRDGFIHFSTAEQLEETISRHFGAERELVVLEVDANALGDMLRWEPSRRGALFPHLHGELPLSAVLKWYVR